MSIEEKKVSTKMTDEKIKKEGRKNMFVASFFSQMTTFVVVRFFLAVVIAVLFYLFDLRFIYRRHANQIEKNIC
jgi:hypothetical protein